MILATVIAKTTVHNIPRKVGDVVEVCEHTFRNLVAKGRLEAAPEDAEVTPEPEDPIKPKPKRGKKSDAAE